MNNAIFIRDRIVRLLKSEKDFNGSVTAEINGCFSAALDLALPDDNGNFEVYKIAVVPHDVTKELNKKAC